MKYDLRTEIIHESQNGLAIPLLKSLAMFATTHPKAVKLNGSELWEAIQYDWDEWPRDDREDKEILYKLNHHAKEISRESSDASIDAKGFLRLQNGKLIACLANAIQMLKTDKAFEGMLAYNELTMFPVKRKPAPWDDASKWRGDRDWSDHDDTKLTEYYQHHELAIDHSQKSAHAANSVAREHPFHPVRDYLDSLTWDHQPRVGTWLSTYVGAERNKYVNAVGEAWLISAVARVRQPGCQADYTLLLQGRQGILKSSAIRALVGDEFFGDDSGDTSAKDTKLMIHRNWVVELAELAGARKAEVNRIKAFLTCRSDQFRAPYDKRPQSYPRMNVFAASINDDEPFTDETGNRRFWPVLCGAIDIEKLTADRDQLWAEAVVLYEEGKPWWLENEEIEKMATDEQSKRYQHGVWDTAIETWLENPTQGFKEEWHKDSDGKSKSICVPVEPFYSTKNKVTVQDILLHAVRKDLNHLTQSDQNSVARCLKHNGWIKRAKWDQDGVKRGYYHRPGTAYDEDDREPPGGQLEL